MKSPLHLLAWFSIVAFVGLSTARLRAEAAPAALQLDDEDSLVRYALSHNLDLRVVRTEQDVAAAEVLSASALNNPVLRGEWLHVQSPANYGFGVGVEWEPPQPGVYGNGKQAARAESRAVALDFAERAADLEASVRRSYAQIAAFDQEIALASRSVETRRAVQKTVAQRVNRGAASRIELSLTAVSLAQGEQERDLLLLDRATEVANLETLLGLAPDRDLKLPPQTATSALPVSDSLTGSKHGGLELERAAIARRPLLQADAARADAAGAKASAERAKRWPWLSLQARYRRNDQSTYPDDVTLGLQLTLPVFDRNPGPIAAAEAAQREVHDLTLAHRVAITREVRILRAESVRRRELAEHYAEAIAPVLNEHAQLVKQALLGMELDLTALLSAEELVTKGGIEYLQARLAQRKAEIALSRSLGEYGKLAVGGAK